MQIVDVRTLEESAVDHFPNDVNIPLDYIVQRIKKLSMQNWMKKNKLYFIGALLGAITGFLDWKYVGCLTGTCAITSNPFRSTIYGTIMGSLLLSLFNKSSKKQIQND